MKSVATSVRITAASNALLTALSGRTGKPKAQIVEEALHDWEERAFWSEVQSSFASTPETAELREERQLWDQTVGDGLVMENRAPKAGRRKKSGT